MTRTVKILKADKPNSNQRTYPMSVLCNIVDQCAGDSIYGHIGMAFDCHGGDSIYEHIDKQMFVPTVNISHKVSNLRIEDGYLIGDVTTLNTPPGRILAETIDLVTFRSAGMGSISKDGTVADDFVLMNINAVMDGVDL